MKQEKILSRNFCFSFLALLGCAMVMYMLLTTVTEYATAFGASSTLAGLVSGAYIIAGLLTRLWSGRALARMHWKKLAAAAAAVHFLACCSYFFIKDLGLLILIRFIHGLGFGATSNGILTIGVSTLPKSRFSEANGYFMIAPTIAVALGPYLGGLAYDNFGPYGSFAAASILSALTLVFILLVDLRGVEMHPQDKAADAPRGIDSVLERRAISISMCVFVIVLGYVAIMSFYRLYAAEVGLSREFSYFPLIYAVMLLIMRPLAGRIQDRIGDNPVCYPGIIVQVIGLLCIGLAPGVWSIIVCSFCCAMGYGLMNSACNAIACRRVPPERRSVAVSTFWICCDIGMGLGPVILGAVQSASGNYPVMYCVAAALSLLTLPVYHFAWGRSGGKIRRKAERK